MIVTYITIDGDGLGDFFQEPGWKGLNVSKEMAKFFFKNPGPALDITANLVTAAAFGNPKATLTTLLELITFYPGTGLILRKFVWFFVV